MASAAGDLAYAIMDGWDTVILIDATPRQQPPGTVSLIDPDLSILETDTGEIVNAHGLNPVSVLQMVRSLGGTLPQLYLVGCELRRAGDERTRPERRE